MLKGFCALCVPCLVFLSSRQPCDAFGIFRDSKGRTPKPLTNKAENGIESSRRKWFEHTAAFVAATAASATTAPLSANAAAPEVASAITDKIFVEIKGLPGSGEGSQTTKRIVIGLFGKDAPWSVEKLRKLAGPAGLIAPCKPKEERMLQREQLEANKVYNSCLESQENGVNYDYAQIWRVIKGERIDFGSVAGKFVAREPPIWEEDHPNSLKHDRAGIVSVRRGSDSGFGFTIYPAGKAAVSDLDETHIVVGQVLEGLDVVEEINLTPVVASSKVNYMGLTGGASTKSAPSRACRYGGPMYCNENKPLVKLTMYRTGQL